MMDSNISESNPPQTDEIRAKNGLNSADYKSAVPEKRILHDPDNPLGSSKRLKKIRSIVESSKNAIMQLNELKPGLNYVVERRQGPPHQPVFVISVTLDGKKFTGKGLSKQFAKHAAAEAALKSFTSDMENISESDVESVSDMESVSVTESLKNAISQLNELKPGLSYVVESREGPSHQPVFVISVNVDGKKFIGKGLSKQLAKRAAAEAAFKSLTSSMLGDDNSDAERPDVSDNEQLEERVPVNESSDNLEETINSKLQKLYAEIDTRNPLFLLNELRSDLLGFIVRLDEASAKQKFVATINVDGKVFTAAGKDKKNAKNAAD